MALIKLKLKEKSYKDFLVTGSGQTIDKNSFTIVDDDDSDIQYYIANRDDLLFSDVKETLDEKDTTGDLSNEKDNNKTEFKETSGKSKRKGKKTNKTSDKAEEKPVLQEETENTAE